MSVHGKTILPGNDCNCAPDKKALGLLYPRCITSVHSSTLCPKKRPPFFDSYSNNLKVDIFGTQSILNSIFYTIDHDAKLLLSKFLSCKLSVAFIELLCGKFSIICKFCCFTLLLSSLSLAYIQTEIV